MRVSSAPSFAAFSPDGSEVLASQDGTLRRWNAQTQTEESALTTPSGQLLDGAFSRDGTRLVFASVESNALIYEWPSQTLLRSVSAFRSYPCTRVQWGPDHETLHAASSGNKTRTFTVATNSNAGHPLPSRRGMHALVASPDGNCFCALTQTELVLWNPFEGVSLLKVPALYYHGGDSTDEAVFHPDGSTLWAQFRSAPHVRVWNTDGSEKLCKTITLDEAAYSIAISPTGKLLAVGLRREVALLQTSDGMILRRWNAPNGTQQHSGSVHVQCFSPDETQLLTTDCTGGIYLWNTETGSLLQP